MIVCARIFDWKVATFGNGESQKVNFWQWRSKNNFYNNFYFRLVRSMSPRPLHCPRVSLPIVTDAFVQSFVAKKCRDIIDDVEKLDAIQDGFIHFQLIRFCQVTRLQYLNSQIILGNRCVLQQDHVDCKITDALLKKGTKQHADGWDTPRKDWAHMVLHLPDTEGGFGVPFNCVTKDAAFYTTTSSFVTCLGAFPQVLSLRNVRTCGCLKMTFGTRPHGHRPRLCFFETFTPSFSTNTTAKRRSVRSLNHRLT
jgi:hypothetical protein